MKADLLIFKNNCRQGLDLLKETREAYQLLLVFGDRELMCLPDVIPG